MHSVKALRFAWEGVHSPPPRRGRLTTTRYPEPPFSKSCVRAWSCYFMNFSYIEHYDASFAVDCVANSNLTTGYAFIPSDIYFDELFKH